MKKAFLFVFMALLSISTMPTALASNDIKVLLDGEYVDFDAQPFIEDGRTLVPIRAITEAMGCEVEWNAGTQTADISNDESKVSIKIGSTTITKTENSTHDKQNITIDVPAKIYMDRTYVPLRAVSEAFGAEVGWNGNQKLVTITYAKWDSEEAISFSDEAFEYSVRLELGNIYDYDWGDVYDGELTEDLLSEITELNLYNSSDGTKLESIADIEKLPNLNRLTIDDEIEDIEDFSIVSDSDAGFKDFGFELCVRMNIAAYYEGSTDRCLYIGKITDEMLSKVTCVDAGSLPDFVKISNLEDLNLVPNIEELLIPRNTENISDYSPIGSHDTWRRLNLSGVDTQDDSFLYNIKVTDAIGFPNVSAGMYLYLDEGISYAQALDAYNTVKSKLELLDSQMSNASSDYEKYKTIHDFLAENMEYDYDFVENAGSNDVMYLSLAKGKGECWVYSEAYQKLCKQYGLKCWIVQGEAIGVIYDDDVPSWGEHEWNIVNLDDEYYHVDVTYDDPIGSNDLRHSYFLVSDSTMKSDHKWGEGTEFGNIMFDFTTTVGDDVVTDILACPKDYRQ